MTDSRSSKTPLDAGNSPVLTGNAPKDYLTNSKFKINAGYSAHGHLIDSMRILDSTFKEVGNIADEKIVATCPLPPELKTEQFAALSEKGTITIRNAADAKIVETYATQAPAITTNSIFQFSAHTHNNKPAFIVVAKEGDRAPQVFLHRICSEDAKLEPTRLECSTANDRTVSPTLSGAKYVISIQAQNIFLYPLSFSEKSALKPLKFTAGSLQSHYSAPIGCSNDESFVVLSYSSHLNPQFYRFQYTDNLGTFTYQHSPTRFSKQARFVNICHHSFIYLDKVGNNFQLNAFDPATQKFSLILETPKKINHVFEHPQGMGVQFDDGSIGVYKMSNPHAVETETALSTYGIPQSGIQKLICRLAFFGRLAMPTLGQLKDTFTKKLDALLIPQTGITSSVQAYKEHVISQIIAGLSFIQNRVETAGLDRNEYLQEMKKRHPIWETILSPDALKDEALISVINKDELCYLVEAVNNAEHTMSVTRDIGRRLGR